MFFIYRLTTIFFFPIFVIFILLRVCLKKEDSKRFKEKIFKPISKNFKKSYENLIWFHGASIGEILSVKPLIEKFTREKNTKILITSVTTSSAEIIKKKFKKNKNIKHFYFPLDAPHLVNSFLKTFKPNLAVFIDSEIWPNFIYEIKNKNIPLALINARITNRTFHKWNTFKKFSRNIFSSFDICLASSLNSKKNLKKLNSNNIKYIGNLKFIKSKTKKIKLSNSTKLHLDKNKVWCAISTHEPEEKFCMETHRLMKKKYSGLITIIIPRHVNRAQSIFLEAKKLNLNSQILNEESVINKSSEILIINSYGTLTKYMKYCKSVFLGKSMMKKLLLVGGQNPIEAAYAGCFIYHGPYVYNFKEVYDYLYKNKISKKIHNSKELASNLIKDFERKNKFNKNNINRLNKYGNKILQKTFKELKSVIL